MRMRNSIADFIAFRRSFIDLTPCTILVGPEKVGTGKFRISRIMPGFFYGLENSPGEKGPFFELAQEVREGVSRGGCCIRG